MKHSFLTFISATSMVLRWTAAYNFDDQERVLQRTRDMRDNSPMTDEEAGRFRSMVDKGRLKIVNERPKSLPGAAGDKNAVVRALKKSKSEKERHADGAARGSANTHRTRGSEPRDGKRNAPTDVTRTEPKQEHRPKKSGGTARTAPPPEGNGPRNPKKAGRHHGYAYGYDDDAVVYDDYVSGDDYAYSGEGDYSGGDGGSGLNYVFMFFEGFQDGRNLAGGIPPNPSLPDEFDAGATYLFNREGIYGVTYDEFSGNSTTGILVDETDLFAEVTGKCIRTDPHDELDFDNYVGRAYCQFVYTSTGSVDDALTVEGPIQIGEDAVLTVTGGLGIYRRTVGQMYLTPVEPNALSSSPPSIEFSYELDLPSSYYMQAYIYMDQSLIPPEALS